MSYSYKTTVQTPDGSDREIYVHAGKDVDEFVADSIGKRLHDNPGLLFETKWSDYLDLKSPYDNETYRLYQEDKWTFRVEL